MEGIKVYGIMVIYNKCLKDSAAYTCLKEQDVELVICDNSTKDYGNADIAERDGRSYISMGSNQGLSRAYNKALDYIFSNYEPDSQDVICLFDDDTKIPTEYFQAVKEETAQIMLPIVKDSIGIMSPVSMKKRIATRFASQEEAVGAEEKILSGINSAMAIRVEIFEKFRYNEEMFLDYIDHQFIMDMRERGIYPKVIQVEVVQDFSALNDSKEAARARFRIQKKDLRIFYRKNPILYYYITLKKHLRLVIKYKDIKMMFC